MRRLRSKSAHKCIPYNNRCAKFYPDRLRFGSTRAKILFWIKTEKKPSIGLAVNKNIRMVQEGEADLPLSCQVHVSAAAPVNVGRQQSSALPVSLRPIYNDKCRST